MFLEESKTGNCDFLGIDTKDLGMLSNERKGENVSCPLPKLKSAMHQRTYHTSEKMTHKVVKKNSYHMPNKGLLARVSEETLQFNSKSLAQI